MPHCLQLVGGLCLAWVPFRELSVPLTCWVLVVLQEGVVVRVLYICLLQEQHGGHSEGALLGDASPAWGAAHG